MKLVIIYILELKRKRYFVNNKVLNNNTKGKEKVKDIVIYIINY